MGYPLILNLLKDGYPTTERIGGQVSVDNPRPIRHNLTGIQSSPIPIDEALPVLTQVAVSTDPGRPDLTGLAAAQAAQNAVNEWRRELQSRVNSFVELLLAHIRRLSGVTVQDVYPDGLRPWERHPSEPNFPDPEKE